MQIYYSESALQVAEKLRPARAELAKVARLASLRLGLLRSLRLLCEQTVFRTRSKLPALPGLAQFFQLLRDWEVIV